MDDAVRNIHIAAAVARLIAFAFDDGDAVAARVKNDHSGFEVFHVRDVVRKRRPDFPAPLANRDLPALETKRRNIKRDQVKRRRLNERRQAVNAHGGFDRWRRAAAHHPGALRDALMQREVARTGGRRFASSDAGE